MSLRLMFLRGLGLIALITVHITAAADDRETTDDRETFEIGSIQIPQTVFGGSTTSFVVLFGGKSIGAIGSEGGEKLLVWDIANQELINSRPVKTGFLGHLRASPDGGLLAQISDRGVELINLASEQSGLLHKTDFPVEWCRDAAFSPDGTTLAVVIERQDGGGVYTSTEIVFYDTATKQKNWPEMSYSDRVERIAFLPTGMLASNGLVVKPSEDQPAVAPHDRRVQLWDIVLREKQTSIEHVEDAFIAFTRDAGTLATGRTIISLDNGALISRLERPHKIKGLVMDPQGRWMATGGDDNHLLFWDPATGKKLAGFRAHDGSVNAVELAQDGRTLVSIGNDGVIRFWDIEKILQSKPMDAYVEKLADAPMAKEAWILADELLQGLLREFSFDDSGPTVHIENAKQAAKSLGIAIPELPQDLESSDQVMDWIQNSERTLVEQINSKHGNEPTAMFIVAYRTKIAARHFPSITPESKESIAKMVEVFLGDNFQIPSGCWRPFADALRNDSEIEVSLTQNRLREEIRAYLSR